MAKNLVIVESPAKAKTIGRYLGHDYEVVASVGHVRDLPSKTMAVDIQNDFKPEYEIMPGKKTVIQNLKKLAKDCEVVYLATDPDREGEAISWHIMESISTKAVAKRVIFHEITENGVREAFNNPTSVNMDLVDAQQARRILDRVVGYELSPLLWKKFTSGYKLGLSAGRVQSVALKLIVEREKAINDFTPEEYWIISAELIKSEDKKKLPFNARLTGSKRYSREDAELIEQDLPLCNFVVDSVSNKISKLKPEAPFKTSTLQQEASRRLSGFSVSRTMRIAQQLYEGIALGSEAETGLITYMRTDSTVLSATATTEINEFIRNHYGEQYLGTGSRRGGRKSAVAAQEAHEAIRPTSINRTPEQVASYLTGEQLALYTLIWRRALASRMADTANRITTVNILATKTDTIVYKLSSSGSEPEFDGYMKIYNIGNAKSQESVDDEDSLDDQEAFQKMPRLTKGEELALIKVNNDQKFTRPAPRYSQASFVKTLEESGIGRPSTYASIMATLEGRNYCSLENGRYVAEPLGIAIVGQLDPYFPNIMDVEFTAKMETNLDEIANGNKQWVKVLEEFYNPYRELFLIAESSMPKVTVQTPTGESCPECERPLAEKIGRNGKFIACTGFPECRYSKPYQISTGVACPECGGDLLTRRSKKGRTFYGCSNFPSCNFTLGQRPLPQPCPECGKLLVARGKTNSKCTSCEFLGPLPQDEAIQTVA